jgi:outer membrane receptor for ferrienterochelin and colicin
MGSFMKFRVGIGAILAMATPLAAHGQDPAAKPAAPAVQEVVVVAGASPKQTRIDRQVYSVTRNLQASTGTAADILSDIPSVAVDVDGNVSLRGDSNVTILVDGKPSAEFSGAAKGLSLQQFSASDIDRVEVLTTPPSQYKAEGSGGVINIVTKKHTQAGASGSGQLMLGDKRRYVAAFDGAFNQGPWKVSGGIGLRQDAKERLTSYNRSTLDASSGLFDPSRQTIDEQFLRLIPSVKGSVEYAFTAKSSLTASFSHRELTGNRYFDQHDEDGAVGALTSSSNRHSDGHEWAIDASEGLRFDQQLGRPGETLSLGLQRSATGERERYAYTNTFALPAAPVAYDDLHLGLDLVKTEVSADYTLPLGGERQLRLGYDFEDDRNDYNNFGDTIDAATLAATRDPSVTNHFQYRQQVHAGYAQYETPLGPWRLQAGLRIEAAGASFFDITDVVPGARRDFGVYPSLHLDRDVGEMDKLTLGVSRRITRPDPEALNPFSDHQDTHNLRAGNPFLRPQDTWIAEAGYTTSHWGQSLGGTAYVRQDRDAVTDVLQPISQDVVLATKTNLPQSRAGGLEFSLNGKILPQLSYSLSGDAFYAQIDASTLGLAGLRSTTGVNLKASLDARLSPVDTAQMSVTRQDRRLTPQGFIGAINQVNFGYKRQLRPDLAFMVTLTDAFDGQRTRRIIDSPTLHDDYLRHQLGRVALVGFSYTFGGSKKAKAGGFQYDQ